MTTGDEPTKPEPDTTDGGQRTVGSDTLAMMVGAIERTNEQAMEAVTQQATANTKRLWLIVIVTLLIIAALAGVTTAITLPDGPSVETTPAPDAADAPDDPPAGAK